MSSKYKERRNHQRRMKLTVAPITLGCPKNVVDSERMLGLLRRKGYRIVGPAEEADLVLINTCGFLESARSEASEVIEEIGRLKASGGPRAIVVAGCMVQHEGPAVARRFPYVDWWVGVRGREQIADIMDHVAGLTRSGRADQSRLETKGRRFFAPDGGDAPLEDTDRVRLTHRHVAYLKIAEGCDRRCAFCAIPSIRGRFISKPVSQVVDEAARLADDGVRELILVAQETTYYGMDTDGRPRLAELLDALGGVRGLEWIRLMYTYPQHFDDRLIEQIASSGRVVPYIDLPLQHASDSVLRRMQRRVCRDETEALLERLRSGIPDLAIRTSMIVGFPGETDADFEQLLDFVRTWRFERLGIFEFSLEPGTPAASLAGRIPDEVMRERHDRLSAAQQEIAFAWNQSRLARREDVLIDYRGDAPDADDLWIGRTYADAPEIDSVVYVTGRDLRAGRVVPCEIVAVSGYDLAAVPVEPDSPA